MRILVTGATANIGRKVVDHLLSLGAKDIRALTTNPAKAALPTEVEAVRGFIGRPETLAGAFDGVDRMYLAPSPDTTADVLALAHKAGVRHVVALDGEPESWWGTVTSAVENSGLEWTHLWPGDFFENVGIWAQQIHTTGTIREPHPDAASTPIAMDDIAAVAAAALFEDGHAGKTYPLTGPEALTRRELVAQLAAALGYDIPFVPVSRDEAVAVFTPAMGETAEWYVDSVLGGLAAQTPAPNRVVEQVTGRPATTFAEWAATNAAATIGPRPTLDA
ncbi:NAD(P)H-binding protein [Nocardia huaxiensis]|uniref:NAD(P)H-binding protein n=1 Tax=Nocardia huaxiensis TaxID=2755382 RepID=A0A7D6VIT8_9NOCA|nr:NAD(P)H-binding protein [Nocardia huaxiensis]QLY33837.1 NAD(P)H-binding protein [Nocardia huaxiensis]UFS99236.1 NAD(P)H-binding protein [Nocardia huaxiensis]